MKRKLIFDIITVTFIMIIIFISTTGIPFNAVPSTATIPANGTLSLRLTGTPEETGTLSVRGCIIKIVGFAEQEFLVDYSQKSKEAKDTRNSRSSSSKEDQPKNELIKLKRRYIPLFLFMTLPPNLSSLRRVKVVYNVFFLYQWFKCITNKS